MTTPVPPLDRDTMRRLLDGTLPIRDYIDARLIEAMNARLVDIDAEIERELLEGPIR